MGSFRIFSFLFIDSNITINQTYDTKSSDSSFKTKRENISRKNLLSSNIEEKIFRNMKNLIDFRIKFNLNLLATNNLIEAFTVYLAVMNLVVNCVPKRCDTIV